MSTSKAYSADMAGTHLTVSDGRRTLGHIVERAGECASYDAAGKLVGVFGSRASARLALQAWKGGAVR